MRYKWIPVTRVNKSFFGLCRLLLNNIFHVKTAFWVCNNMKLESLNHFHIYQIHYSYHSTGKIFILNCNWLMGTCFVPEWTLFCQNTMVLHKLCKLSRKLHNCHNSCHHLRYITSLIFLILTINLIRFVSFKLQQHF